jgi:putative ABC transport system permease protein
MGFGPTACTSMPAVSIPLRARGDLALRYRSPMTAPFVCNTPVTPSVPVPMNAWRMGWRMAWRDARSGELTMLLLAVALAVSALSAVSFFADRLQGGLQRDAQALLGGDAVVRSDQAPLPEWVDWAQSLGLRQAQWMSFPTMVRATDAQGGQTRLVSLKAVSGGYPLRGQLLTRSSLVGPEQSASEGPSAGTLWVDPQVLDALGVQLGDSVWLGDALLQLTRVITLESDRGAGFISFSPRVMMNAADVAATGLVQPASRISYRLAVAGQPDAVQAFEARLRKAVDADQGRGARLETLEGGRPETNQTLDRARDFLNLVAMLTVVLCAVAVANGARHFAQSRLDNCAMFRVLGVSQTTMTWAFALELALVGLVGSAVGLLVGLLLHQGFVVLLGALLKVALPLPGWRPVLLGLGLGAALIVSFGMPTVMQLAKVPPLRVMRRDLGSAQAAPLLVLGLGGLSLVMLMVWAAGDWKLGLMSAAGVLGAAVVFAAAAWAAVRALQRWVKPGVASAPWVLATRSLGARPTLAVVQVGSVALGLMALALLVLLRTDLIDSWRAATPPDAPNRFVINIQRDQADAFKGFLQQAGVTQPDWYPMVRGRWVEHNGNPVRIEDFEGDERAQRLASREFNLSFAAQAPDYNTIEQGRWSGPDSQGVSMEAGIMQTLKLQLGDEIGFDIAGQIERRKITSVRKVDWASMRVNFFAMFAAADMPQWPTTFIAAYRSPEQAKVGEQSLDNALIHRFPNVTQINTTATLAQVQAILDQVIAAVEFLFGFGVAAGLVVLVSTLVSTRDQRLKEMAIYRALGARAPQLRAMLQVELLGLGALAGGLASAAAWLMGDALARWVFEFEWTASWWWLPSGAVVGALLALVAGYWSLRTVLNTPVWQTLRQVNE